MVLKVVLVVCIALIATSMSGPLSGIDSHINNTKQRVFQSSPSLIKEAERVRQEKSNQKESKGKKRCLLTYAS